MDFYLNLLNDKERAPDDQPSIGIILCAEKDELVVEFSLKTKTNPIGVEEYQLTDKLPSASELRMAPAAGQIAAKAAADRVEAAKTKVMSICPRSANTKRLRPASSPTRHRSNGPACLKGQAQI